jgi:serine/threonine-protein kinase
MNREINMFFRSLGTGLLVGVFVWLMYIALEPFVRRRWPKALVSWNRMLAGRFRDPLVGRDILTGAAVGVGIGLWFWADNLARNLLGLLPEMPETLDLDLLLGTRWMVGGLFWNLFNIIFVSTFFLFVLTLVTVLLRNRWIALGLLVVVFSVINSFQAEYFWIDVAMNLVLWGSLLVTMFRFGLVAAISLWFFGFTVIATFPLTLDFTVWYSGNAIISLVVAAAVAIFGFYTSLAGRPVFQDLLGQE